MASRILADIEKGVTVLVHEHDALPTDGAQIPDHLVPAVMTFAARLGLEADKLTGGEAGVLFDLIGHAVESVQVAQEGAGHAHAGSAASGAAEAPETAQEAPHAAETEVSADNPTGIVGGSAEQTPAAEQAQDEQPAAEQGAPADHSADIDAAVKAAQAWPAAGSGGSAA